MDPAITLSNIFWQWKKKFLMKNIEKKMYRIKNENLFNLNVISHRHWKYLKSTIVYEIHFLFIEKKSSNYFQIDQNRKSIIRYYQWQFKWIKVIEVFPSKKPLFVEWTSWFSTKIRYIPSRIYTIGSEICWKI